MQSAYHKKKKGSVKSERDKNERRTKRTWACTHSIVETKREKKRRQVKVIEEGPQDEGE